MEGRGAVKHIVYSASAMAFGMHLERMLCVGYLMPGRADLFSDKTISKYRESSCEPRVLLYV